MTTRRYEMHLSLDPKQYYQARIYCSGLKRKTKLVLVSNDGGEHPLQLIVTRWTKELNHVEDAVKEVKEMANDFHENGFTVLRRKCEYELPPDVGDIHPLEADRQAEDCCYLEFHIRIKDMMGGEEVKEALLPLQPSFSVSVGQDHTYVTLRYFISLMDLMDGVYADMDWLIARLKQMGYTIDKIHREACVFDDNVDHDKGWIQQ